jgi:hypothetical protein
MTWKLSDIQQLQASGKIRGYKDTIKQPEICTTKAVKKCKSKKPPAGIPSPVPPVIFIGIDCGTHTGFAAWNSPEQRFDKITTITMDEAKALVKQYHSSYAIIVYVEDARQRKWFGENADAKRQGAGSVKREASSWEEFLLANQIPFEMKHPLKGMTKLSKRQFAQITGYTGLTSEHARDAAMMVVKS